MRSSGCATSVTQRYTSLHTHFYRERPHQGLGNEIIAPQLSTVSPAGETVEIKPLGWLLRSYERTAVILDEELTLPVAVFHSRSTPARGAVAPCGMLLVDNSESPTPVA